MRIMKCAIAQLNPKIGDLDGNVSQILDAADQAKSQGARILFTPELSLCGYPPRDLLLQTSFIQRLADAIAKLTAQLPQGVAVLVGTVVMKVDASVVGAKKLYNSMVWLEDGELKQTFHKRLLPTYDVFDEDSLFCAWNNSKFDEN